MKVLSDLSWQPRWLSHVGCLEGCVNYLDLGISQEWLWGGCGHAFVLNVHDQLCPSGPTAWVTTPIFGLGENVGYLPDGVARHKSADDFAWHQEATWRFVRRCIDVGIPCYGFELDIPEFYVICGYDGEDYLYRGPGFEEEYGRRSWRELGTSEIGFLEVYSVTPHPPEPDQVVVREALSFALKHAQDPGQWVLDGYHTGAEGYQIWANALRSGQALRFGQSYNAEVWAECRRAAEGFLVEAKERLPGMASDAFDRAANAYGKVARALTDLAQLIPFSHEVGEEETVQSEEGADLVEGAAAAEARGLEVAEEMVETLS